MFCIFFVDNGENGMLQYVTTCSFLPPSDTPPEALLLVGHMTYSTVYLLTVYIECVWYRIAQYVHSASDSARGNIYLYMYMYSAVLTYVGCPEWLTYFASWLNDRTEVCCEYSNSNG